MKVLLVCIAKYENHYLKEFVEHYKKLGFDNIMFYDNNDKDDFSAKEILKSYIDEGFVIYKPIQGLLCQQKPSYTDGYNTMHDKYDWIAFFDLDELLVLKKDNNIKDFLSREIYKDCNEININWKNYGDNDLIGDEQPISYNMMNRLTKPIIKQGMPYRDTSYKSIVKTQGIPSINCNHVHKISDVFKNHVYQNGKPSTFKGTNECDASFLKEIDYEYAQLNHYCTKTISEYILKCKHGSALQNRIFVRDFNRFFRFNQLTAQKKSIIEKLKNIPAKESLTDLYLKNIYN